MGVCEMASVRYLDIPYGPDNIMSMAEEVYTMIKCIYGGCLVCFYILQHYPVFGLQ